MKQLRFLLLAVLCCGILPSAAQIYIVDPVGSPADEIEAVAVTDSTLVYDKKDTLRAGDVITVVRVINNGDRAVYQNERGQFSVRGYMLKFSDDNPEGTIDKFEENNTVDRGYFSFNRHSWFGHMMYGLTFPILIFLLIGAAALLCFLTGTDKTLPQYNKFRPMAVGAIMVLAVVEIFYVGMMGSRGFWWADISVVNKLTGIIMSILLLGVVALQVFMGMYFTRTFQGDDNSERRLTLKPLYVGLGVLLVVLIVLSIIDVGNIIGSIATIGGLVGVAAWFVHTNAKVAGRAEGIKFCVIAMIYAYAVLQIGIVAISLFIQVVVWLLMVAALIFVAYYVFTAKRGDGTNPFFEQSKEEVKRQQENLRRQQQQEQARRNSDS